MNQVTLAAVQKRREFPARFTQTIQVGAHRGFARIFDNPGPLKAPWQVKLALGIPGIHRLLGYAVGIGARPEHVRNARHPAPRGRSLLSVSIGVIAGVAAAIVTVRMIRKRELLR